MFQYLIHATCITIIIAVLGATWNVQTATSQKAATAINIVKEDEGLTKRKRRSILSADNIKELVSCNLFFIKFLITHG